MAAQVILQSAFSGLQGRLDTQHAIWGAHTAQVPALPPRPPAPPRRTSKSGLNFVSKKSLGMRPVRLKESRSGAWLV